MALKARKSEAANAFSGKFGFKNAEDDFDLVRQGHPVSKDFLKVWKISGFRKFSKAPSWNLPFGWFLAAVDA